MVYILGILIKIIYTTLKVLSKNCFSYRSKERSLYLKYTKNIVMLITYDISAKLAKKYWIMIRVFRTNFEFGILVLYYKYKPD